MTEGMAPAQKEVADANPSSVLTDAKGILAVHSCNFYEVSSIVFMTEGMPPAQKEVEGANTSSDLTDAEGILAVYSSYLFQQRL